MHPSPRIGVERSCHVAVDRDRPDFTVKCTKLSKTHPPVAEAKIGPNQQKWLYLPARKFCFFKPRSQTAGPPIRGRVHPFLQLSNLTNTGYQKIQGVPMPEKIASEGRSVGPKPIASAL